MNKEGDKTMDRTGNKFIGCGEETIAIQIIDRGEGNSHYEPVYAAGGAKRKFTKVYDIQGEVSAELCENCGLIMLRGARKK
jgi:hypothetical protein